MVNLRRAGGTEWWEIYDDNDDDEDDDEDEDDEDENDAFVSIKGEHS